MQVKNLKEKLGTADIVRHRIHEPCQMFQISIFLFGIHKNKNSLTSERLNKDITYFLELWTRINRRNGALFLGTN